MIKVGIDTLALDTSRYSLPLSSLAKARGHEEEKYKTSLGQQVMSVPVPGEDVVTMGANAAHYALRGINRNEIEMLLFATETGTDQSKACRMYVHDMLGLPSRCRVVELKQACYSGTAALQLSLPYLRAHPRKKVLLIAADIARYGLKTSGESSQGAAAIAMVLSSNPRILSFEDGYGISAENVMDFWRPHYLHEALVDGKYSSLLYLTMLEKSWQEYCSESRRNFVDHDYFCYHNSVPRLVEKAHHHLIKWTGCTHLTEEMRMKQIQYSLEYARLIGNSYTASLYIGLASLLDKHLDDLSGKRVGFYSYGSGCVAEYFSGVIEPTYRSALHTDYHTNLFANRQSLTVSQYESLFQFKYPEDGSDLEIPQYNTGLFRLARFHKHKRIYESLTKTDS